MVEGLFQPIHLILILAVILIVFGAGKLPEMGGALGRGIREFKTEVQDATSSEPDNAPKAPIASTQAATAAVPSTYCTTCGDRVPSGSRFCPSCGASITPVEIPAGPIATPLEAGAPSQDPPRV